ncbi:hypothetical protein ADIWIN_0788 [Winogradskyella psychrotolerans RS-3]|uniref:Uncharacterized protein n=2 Tax=Winogradskyella TaxID=286104 RepID=S7VVV3_9FLAO|nr:hypothetical protein ADIWIN_0788 [Winogradskyella psychrotolerans RS-3]
MYTLVVLLIAITIVSCSKDTVNETEAESAEFSENPLTIEQINQRISESIRTTGDFDWNNENAHFLWSALMHGQNVLTVGYGNEGQSFGEAGDADLQNKKRVYSLLFLLKKKFLKQTLNLKKMIF